MPLYTKAGDTGQTVLYGGTRISKTDPWVHSYGSVDELSAILGVILVEKVSPDVRQKLQRIQHQLYISCADLATPLARESKRITEEDVREIEQWIDGAESRVPELTQFILPGGTHIGALLHQARTVCRRAERWLVALCEREDINPECLKYLNRLGDYFFALARVVNSEAGVEEIKAG